MILTKIFHRPLSASALSAGLPIDDSGMSPELFLRAAERAGFSARLLRKPLRTVSSLSLPAVLLLRDRRACVLTKIEAPDGAIVVVPESGDGERRITLNKLEAQYEGLALITQQEYRFDNRAEDIAPLRRRSWFWGTLASLWRVYLQVALAAILINLFALASPLFIMNVYDRVVPNNAISTLWVLAVGAATVFGFDFLLRTIRGYFIDVAGKSADTQLSAAIFQQVLGMRLASRPTSAGAFANTLREFDPLRDFFTSATLATLIDLPFALFFIAVVWGVAGAARHRPGCGRAHRGRHGYLASVSPLRRREADLPRSRSKACTPGRSARRTRDHQEHQRRRPGPEAMGAFCRHDGDLKHEVALPVFDRDQHIGLHAELRDRLRRHLRRSSDQRRRIDRRRAGCRNHSFGPRDGAPCPGRLTAHPSAAIADFTASA